MSTLTERFIETKNGETIRIYVTSSEEQYPHAHFLRFDYPFDPECRHYDIHSVRQTLQKIDSHQTDRLFLEDTDGITLKFKKASDLMLFRIANEFSPDNPIEQSFSLIDNPHQDKRRLVRVRNHFEKARRNAGIHRDRFASQIDPYYQTVDVITASVDEHLAVWRHLPKKTRDKLELAS